MKTIDDLNGLKIRIPGFAGEVMDFPPEVIARLNQEKETLLNEFAANDPMAKRIIDSQRQYLSKARPWTDISTKAYLNSN